MFRVRDLYVLIVLFLFCRRCSSVDVIKNTEVADAADGDSEDNAAYLSEIQSRLREIFSNERSYIDDSESSGTDGANDVGYDAKLNGWSLNDQSRYPGEVAREDLRYVAQARSLQPSAHALLAQYELRHYGYLNEWVVHLQGGAAQAATVLTSMGYHYHGPVTGFPDLYRTARHGHPRLHKRAAPHITRHLSSHRQVVWAEQQVSKIREKRYSVDLADLESDKPVVRVKRALDDNVPEQQRLDAQHNTNPEKELVDMLRDWPTQNKTSGAKNELSDIFNDELVNSQWYLYDTRVMPLLPRLDLGVVGAWRQGLTGEGVRVTVLDDGIDYTHDDLKHNYDPSISHDFNDDDDDPLPRFGPMVRNSHGTKCAGEVAMAANNVKCGVGIAFKASIGGIRMLDGHVSDRVEAESLSHARGRVDIVTSSWGPSDDGRTVEGPGKLVKEALKKGVEEGRAGKGTVFIWASGNGGLADDNCNCDGYTSSIYTTSITSSSQSNTSPWYGERCASTLTSAYSSGAYSDQKIISTDLNNTCTTTFAGTSAAAPLAAGVVALALQANPSLTWRDVQHLVVVSSNYETLAGNEGWAQNALGFHFNLRFGFGLLDASKLVSSARAWQNVPGKVTCEVNATRNSNTNWSFDSQGTVSLEFDVTSCDGGDGSTGVYLEHVEAVLSINHSCRGALELYLTSPRGTKTVLLTQRPADQSKAGFVDWPFMSVHTWGEDPRGTWTLRVNDTSAAGNSGRVTRAALVLHAATAVPAYAEGQYGRQYNFHELASTPTPRGPSTPATPTPSPPPPSTPS